MPMLYSLLSFTSDQSDSYYDMLLALYSVHHRSSLGPADGALIRYLKMLTIQDKSEFISCTP
jgi:hypothetical protein